MWEFLIYKRSRIELHTCREVFIRSSKRLPAERLRVERGQLIIRGSAVLEGTGVPAKSEWRPCWIAGAVNARDFIMSTFSIF